MDNVKTTTAFLNRLLLVVDGSAESENATAFALKMARALPCELSALALPAPYFGAAGRNEGRPAAKSWERPSFCIRH